MSKVSSPFQTISALLPARLGVGKHHLPELTTKWCYLNKNGFYFVLKMFGMC